MAIHKYRYEDGVVRCACFSEEFVGRKEDRPLDNGAVLKVPYQAKPWMGVDLVHCLLCSETAAPGRIAAISLATSTHTISPAASPPPHSLPTAAHPSTSCCVSRAQSAPA